MVYLGEPKNTKQDFVPQGAVVTFSLPYMTGHELGDTQKGVVISSNDYNSRRDSRPCICPMLSVGNSHSIRIRASSGSIFYLRPDLTTYVGMDYCEVAPLHGQNHEPLRMPAEITQQAIDRFIGILIPTDEKMAEKPERGFLRFGEIGWFEKVPRLYMDAVDRAPVICLTPPSIYRQTGVMLVARAYSRIERYYAPSDIAVGAKGWFDIGFFSTSDIRPIPLRKTEQIARKPPISAGFRAMKGVALKTKAHLDLEAFQKVGGRYPDRRGIEVIPSFLRGCLKQSRDGHYMQASRR